MRIQFPCRHCRVPLSAELRLVGAPVICPHCRSEILVPSASEPTKTETATPEAASETHDSPARPLPRNRRRRRNLVLAGMATACVGVVAIGSYLFFAGPTPAENTSAAQVSRGESPLPAETDTAEIVAEMLNSRAGRLTSTSTVQDLAQELFAVLAEEPAPSLDVPHEPEEAAESASVTDTELRPATTLPSQKARDLFQVKRISQRTEMDLRRELAWAPEVRRFDRASMVSLMDAYANSLTASGASEANFNTEPQVLLRFRPDLSLLPVRSGAACRLPARSANTLGLLSNKLRLYLGAAAPRRASDHRADLATLKTMLWYERRGPKPEWLRVEAIPALMQLLMHEDEPGRRMLVDLLTEIPEKAATVALAQRAVFDMSPSVREAAVRALQDRPKEAYRNILLHALRYPWAPTADHAAEALVSLEDRESVPTLVTFLSRPDPAAPTPLGRSGQMGIREVVRIHHVSNCLMCHPPSAFSSDPVVGVQPGGAGILPPTRGRAALGSRVGPGGHNYAPSGGGRSSSQSLRASASTAVPSPLLVRGDVTYLRQDFSVLQHVDAVGAPRERYDYLVRIRPLRTKELEELQAKQKGAVTYPQREAVLFALRELTGKDFGPNAEDWTVAVKSLD